MLVILWSSLRVLVPHYYILTHIRTIVAFTTTSRAVWAWLWDRTGVLHTKRKPTELKRCKRTVVWTDRMKKAADKAFKKLLKEEEEGKSKEKAKKAKKLDNRVATRASAKPVSPVEGETDGNMEISR